MTLYPLRQEAPKVDAATKPLTEGDFVEWTIYGSTHRGHITEIVEEGGTFTNEGDCFILCDDGSRATVHRSGLRRVDDGR